jgi:hypothetical protein
MVTIVLQMLGRLAFLAGTITLGSVLRQSPSKQNAARTSRVLHFLFWTATNRVPCKKGERILCVVCAQSAHTTHSIPLTFFQWSH